MKTYTIRFEETSVGYFDVEAMNETEALEKFEEECYSGEYDLSYMDVVDSKSSIYRA